MTVPPAEDEAGGVAETWGGGAEGGGSEAGGGLGWEQQGGRAELEW